MSSIDIRFDKIEQIKVINFADLKDDWLTATSLQNVGHGVLIKTQRQNSAAMILHSEAHALHMISALEKALELGWFENLK